ncbi:hypothetical protein BN7_2193 [Wickerhamomyces ciferrii]|uniref:Regulator of G protein signaling superfamily n=1 Tax=Wickerhamomyces ciferrii (strain ATCC 14091 / BCRC 22168 / CBS 111 / JCM 3599 / NBRC 0793 / NRRL Y-1031 F-60-10) TaxID=1206466 RepID=K0KMQ7_WICCF|nr:uncharacterized protein BN7_2193 [Wickerhamomyces ciferrii]CCH42649.1 hypothetical protein BN7_2193 [Wickerhamomyces ciferrii]
MTTVMSTHYHVSFQTPQVQDHTKLTLHEAVSKKIDRTPNGSIFTKDLKNIFALTMICLNLQEKPNSKSKVNFLSKSAPFTFTLQEIIDKMADLSLSVESSTTSKVLSHSIKGDLALSLVKKFMNAKLIHTPADRTRSEPKAKVLLQPTPKGVAIIQSYCKYLGFKNSNYPNVIKSTLNSMDLFIFERSAITDTIVFSEYFIHLLFLKFLGNYPNVWKSTNPHDTIPSSDEKLDNDDDFDFSNFNVNDVLNFNLKDSNSTIEQPSKQSSSSSKVPNLLNSVNNKKPKIRESPLAHNFFTNPESDSHIQYYVSNKGVRLYKDYKFGEKQNINIEYCFNAKAAWQWLMDCTDIMYPHEATNILNLFYKYGLIEPISLSPSTSISISKNPKKKFLPLKTSFFTLSKLGWEISNWNKTKRSLIVSNDEEIMKPASSSLILSNQALNIDGGNNSSDESLEEEPKKPMIKPTTEPLTLKKVLADPGIRYLFRNHLEKEFCSENLEVYLSIKHFNKKMTILKNVIEMQKQEQSKQKIENSTHDDSIKFKHAAKSAVVKLINECLSTAYDIYSSYISIGAPYQLNLNHDIREKIASMMIHPNSPLASSFNQSIDSPIDDSMNLPSQPQPVYIPGKSPIIEQTSNILTNSSAAMLNSSLNPMKKTRLLNNKNLSIDVKNTTTSSVNKGPKTPTQSELSRSLVLLHKLFPLFEAVGVHILKLLEFDSFPKFLASETFAQANI